MRVLVTGATGYIGSRLVPSLLEAGHEVYVGTRRRGGTDDFAWASEVKVRMFDADDPRKIRSATKGMDAVVYLVHAMGGGGDFAERDRVAAERMAQACADHGVERVVYLSGLVPEGAGDLSKHLSSRLEVEQILLDGPVPATVLRAAMVVGGGSTSFEIMRRVSERLPVTTMPSWMRSRIQPIAVEDVVVLITAALEGTPRARAYDVGGDEVLTYAELLARFASAAGLERPQVVVPLVPALVVGEAVAALSGLPRNTVRALVKSLAHDMVCAEDDVRSELAPDHTYLSLDDALRRSLGGQTDATSIDGDVQGEAESDPDWVGTTRR